MDIVSQHVVYAKSVLEHKKYVWIAGRKLSVPILQLVIHDWSKFMPGQFFAYSNRFVGKKPNDRDFSIAWLGHQNAEKHHWEYWITRSDHSHGGSGAVDGCLRMPYNYVIEMVADWMGASMAYTGSWDMTDWLAKNLKSIKLHPAAREDLHMILADIGYKQTA